MHLYSHPNCVPRCKRRRRLSLIRCIRHFSAKVNGGLYFVCLLHEKKLKIKSKHLEIHFHVQFSRVTDCYVTSGYYIQKDTKVTMKPKPQKKN